MKTKICSPHSRYVPTWIVSNWTSKQSMAMSTKRQLQQIAYQSKLRVSPRYETAQTRHLVLLPKLCCKVKLCVLSYQILHQKKETRNSKGVSHKQPYDGFCALRVARNNRVVNEYTWMCGAGHLCPAGFLNNAIVCTVMSNWCHFQNTLNYACIRSIYTFQFKPAPRTM